MGDKQGHGFRGNQFIAFHGTSGAHLAKILREGITPGNPRGVNSTAEPMKVYVTSSLERAKEYAGDRAAEEGGKHEVVLELGLPESMFATHKVYEDFGVYGSIVLELKEVKPEWIIGVHESKTGHSKDWKKPHGR